MFAMFRNLIKSSVTDLSVREVTCFLNTKSGHGLTVLKFHAEYNYFNIFLCNNYKGMDEWKTTL